MALLFGCISLLPAGCANIIPPGGGPKDTLAPVLLSATPRDSTRHFNAKTITLNFDEYVTLDNYSENVIVSPYQKKPPLVESRLRTVTVRLKDSLEPNTTYTINFGNAIKDVNEGNVARQFKYVFTTGDVIDSGSLEGRVQLAFNGKIDTTLIAVLQNNLNDTAIRKLPPRYYAKLDGKGRFHFTNLPHGRFNIFALPNDYNKRLDDSTKLFAFYDSVITIGQPHPPLVLYAFQEFQEKPKTPAIAAATSSGKEKDKDKKVDRRLRFTSSLSSGNQDLLGNIDFVFNRKLKTVDSSKIILSDTNFAPVKDVHFILDTSRTRLTLLHKWPEDTHFKLVLQKTAVADSSDTTLSRNDTIAFKTKKESEYGSVVLRFGSLDLSRHHVLQFVQSDKVVDSIPITQKELRWRLFHPGDYQLRILLDSNQNNTWDPGHFWEGRKQQPELVFPADPAKITVRSNWDNEWDIRMQTDLPPDLPKEAPKGRPGQGAPGRNRNRL